MATDTENRVIPSEVIDGAMAFARLDATTLKRGPHPDNGFDCFRLEADIQQYSAFLAALTVQYRSADEVAFLVDQVQIQHDVNGDTLFWLPGVDVPGR